MAAAQLQLVLDGPEKIQLGDTEIVKCLGCGKMLVRNTVPLLADKDLESARYCSSCRKNLEQDFVWQNGCRIKVMRVRR